MFKKLLLMTLFVIMPALSSCSSGTKDPPSCNELVPELIEMSKDQEGPEIIEVNDVKMLHHMAETTGCTATALTDRGSAFIEFETNMSPQGRSILTMRYPHGI
jgi:hypothetical protein